MTECNALMNVCYVWYTWLYIMILIQIDIILSCCCNSEKFFVLLFFNRGLDVLLKQCSGNAYGCSKTKMKLSSNPFYIQC